MAVKVKVYEDGTVPDGVKTVVSLLVGEKDPVAGAVTAHDTVPAFAATPLKGIVVMLFEQTEKGEPALAVGLFLKDIIKVSLTGPQEGALVLVTTKTIFANPLLNSVAVGV